jgi:hypothetical protein
LDKLGEAHSLFQEFLFGVLEGIGEIAIKLAESAIISGLLSLATGGLFGSFFKQLSPIHFANGGIINEPVAGIGQRSGRTYTFAENMPERVSPMTSFGGHSQPMVITVQGSFRASGRDLISSFREARVIDRKAGGNL